MTDSQNYKLKGFRGALLLEEQISVVGVVNVES